MKTYIIATAMILLANAASNAQVNSLRDAATSGSYTAANNKQNFSWPASDTSIADTKAYYLQKSRNQKTAAWVLLGGGTALIGIGLLIGNRDNSSFDEAGIGLIVGSGGLAACIGSIPLFISARKYKAKANLSFGTQKTSPLVGKQIPALRLQIPLG